jgi:hypothetical protein
MKTTKAKMKTKWDPQNSILDTHLPLQVKSRAVTELNIIDQGDHTYYVTLRLNWYPHLLHVSTVRERSSPRQFKHLDRLLQHIRTYYNYHNTIQLILHKPRNKSK